MLCFEVQDETAAEMQKERSIAGSADFNPLITGEKG